MEYSADQTPPEDWTDGFLAAFAEIGTIRKACSTVGIGKDRVYRRKRSDPVFAAALAEVDDQVVDDVEDIVRDAARNGGIEATQLRAAEIVLKARRPEVYRDRMSLEHGGSIGRQDLSALSDEELDAEFARLAGAS